MNIVIILAAIATALLTLPVGFVTLTSWLMRNLWAMLLAAGILAAWSGIVAGMAYLTITGTPHALTLEVGIPILILYMVYAFVTGFRAIRTGLPRRRFQTLSVMSQTVIIMATFLFLISYIVSLT